MKMKETIPEQKEVDDSEYKQVTGDIYAKLLAFQKLGISLSKDSSNPHFHSKYADLNETLRKVKKPLNDLGVLIIQTTTELGLTTTLRNVEDGTEISASLPWIDGSNAQKRGSEATYYARYTLKRLLALDDDDDDGEKASESKVGEAVRNLASTKTSTTDYQDYSYEL